MLVEAEAAQEAIDVTRAEPRGIVRLTCPIALLDAQVGAMLARVHGRTSAVEVHLDATNRRVDVIGEAIDVALRVRPPPLEDSDLVMRVLADARPVPGRQPGAARAARACRRCRPISRGLPSLGLGAPQHEYLWQLFGPDGAQATIHHSPR